MQPEAYFDQGRGKQSGADVSLHAAVVAGWRDSRCVYFKGHSHRAPATYCPSMSEHNVELVRRGIANVDVFWSMLDEYVVWDLRDFPAADLDSVYVGRDAVIKASRHYWGTWRDYSVEAEELLDLGQSVVVILRERGLGKGSGVPVERQNPQLWTFRGDRIIRWEQFPSRAEAIEAAGLPATFRGPPAG